MQENIDEKEYFCIQNEDITNMGKTFYISEKPLIIAGPCSAESEEQMREIVQSLTRETRITMIRCGVWKPRTRPGGFEGMGEEALRWIAGIKRDNSAARFCCEVAKPEHVELCLQYGIEAVWIGARTSVNPFLVSELAEALRGSGMAVMIKNPITPDVELWTGAIERVQNAGISDIAAIHRGFSTYNSTGYRNNPLWDIPIELKRRLPELPLLCDPSHIGGQRELVAKISQTALDLHFDGLMIECHPHPDMALTDGRQQLTPSQLTETLNQLKLHSSGEATPDDLIRLREQIDDIDNQVLRLLSRRMSISSQIGEIKRRHNLHLFQPERWQAVLKRQTDSATAMGLSAEFIKELMETIHAESIRQQEK